MAIRNGFYLIFQSSPGSQINVIPWPNWPFGDNNSLIERIDVQLPWGASTWAGLTPGKDGQELLISNIDAVSNLTLNNQDATATAVNRFRYTGNLVLIPGSSVLACYYSSISRWVLR